MKIGCIGSGYVGSTTMSVLAYKNLKHDVFITDILKDKVECWNSPNLPIYEPGLDKLIYECRNKNLFFTKDSQFVIENCDLIFICVNTPTKEYGVGSKQASDLSFLEGCCNSIKKYSKSDKILIEKSTVPVGTCKSIRNNLQSNKKYHYTIISNPEFLAEGTAIKDLIRPSRVLLGVLEYSKKDIFCRNLVSKLYSVWVNKNLILKISSWSSELIKLASNSFLAQKLSSINTISIICEEVGGCINSVSRGIGLDPRIGNFFLKSSAGFGGSCFEKDVLNLTYSCSINNLSLVSNYWQSVVDINNYTKYTFVKKLYKKLNFNLNKKNLFIMGLTFKKDTDDARNSSSVDIVLEILKELSRVHVYDPKAKNINVIKNSSNVDLVSRLVSPYVKKNYDAVVVLTDWGLFKKLNYKSILQNSNESPFFVDSRSFINKTIIRLLGFKI